MQVLIDNHQQYDGLAIQSSIGDLDGMVNAVQAPLLHWNCILHRYYYYKQKSTTN